jgi:assimilatory nitrate reductase catalytic subunit
MRPGGTRTTCPYCGVGCGIIASPDCAGGVTIAGDPVHPANSGRLCSKGTALAETLGLETRLLHPMMRGAGGELERCSWDGALDAVAGGLARVIERDGPDAVAFYLSGQLLTEDYYVANKLMKGFIGSANVDTNSRLCMASSVAGHRRAFGADVVPGCYDDLDGADLIVLTGSNAAWCHPVLFQRMLRNGQERSAKLVVIDPRRTATAEEADLHLAIAPGMDAVLFSGLLVHLADSGAVDAGYVDAHTGGFDAALARAREIAPDVDATARLTGLSPGDVRAFFGWFRATPRTVTCYSQGVNQSAQGTDKVNAIINCHLATGRIGRPGMGPFSLTGQPNAMGGREVGGLANQLAAHMGYSPDNCGRVARFWNAPNVARREGLKAVQMFEAIERGRIKALWVMGTNPAVSLPRAGDMARALGKLELFVVSDNVRATDTINAGAHVLLPAAAWGERDGTVTNSERRISRQRAFAALPGEARPDWWIVSQVARRLGYAAAFGYGGAADIFREHAALSAFENGGSRAFDLSGLTQLPAAGYDALAPVSWPVRDAGGTARVFADGGFFTPDGKARFIAIEHHAHAQPASAEFPLRLNTGRLRDQWHTMTRTGLSPRLAEHAAEPVLEVNPDDAAQYGLRDGGFARVASAHGECVLRVAVTPGQRRGSVFAPIHWSGETAPGARIGDLVAPFTDPLSGQPESKGTPCNAAPVEFPTHGLLLSRRKLTPQPGVIWARAATDTGFLWTFAGGGVAWAEWLAASIPADWHVAEYWDEHTGSFRAAAFSGETLELCLFTGPAHEILPGAARLKAAFRQGVLSRVERAGLLSGCGTGRAEPEGATICACFGVRSGAIRAAIESGAASVAAIGERLRAGTNCGSCQPELRRILREAAAHPAGRGMAQAGGAGVFSLPPP